MTIELLLQLKRFLKKNIWVLYFIYQHHIVDNLKIVKIVKEIY